MVLKSRVKGVSRSSRSFAGRPLHFPRHSNTCGNAECGSSLTEYVLVLALIAVVAVPAMQLLGQEVNSVFANAIESFDSSGNNDGGPPSRPSTTEISGSPEW